MQKDNDNNIRPPDSVIRERLISNTYIDSDDEANEVNDIHLFEDEFEKVVQLSLQEYNNQSELSEKNQIEFLSQEHKIRVTKFNNVKIIIKKILLYDKQFSEICNMILTVIDLYEGYHIEKFEIEIETYKEIYNFIKSIRLTEEEKQNLLHIFVIE